MSYHCMSTYGKEVRNLGHDLADLDEINVRRMLVPDDFSYYSKACW